MGVWKQYPVTLASRNRVCPGLLCSPTCPFSASVCPIREMGEHTGDCGSVGTASCWRNTEKASPVCVRMQLLGKGREFRPVSSVSVKRIGICGHEVMGFGA